MKSALRIKPNSQDLAKLLEVMVEVSHWELEQSELLQTASGRELYFYLAATLINKGRASDSPIKGAKSQTSERGMRLRIRDFEKKGLLVVSQNQTDRRVRTLMPTDKFESILNEHLENAMRSMSSNFYMLQKKPNKMS